MAPVTRAAARAAQPELLGRLPNEVVLLVRAALRPWTGTADVFSFHRDKHQAIRHVHEYHTDLLRFGRVNRRVHALISASVLAEVMVFDARAPAMLAWLRADPGRLASVREILLEADVTADAAADIHSACASMPALRSFIVRGRWTGPLPLQLPVTCTRIGVSNLPHTMHRLADLVRPVRRIRHLRVPRIKLILSDHGNHLQRLRYLFMVCASSFIPAEATMIVAAPRLHDLNIRVKSLRDVVALLGHVKTAGGLARLQSLSITCNHCSDGQLAAQIWSAVPDSVTVLRLSVSGHGAAGAEVVRTLGQAIDGPRTAGCRLPHLVKAVTNLKPGGCDHCAHEHDRAVAIVTGIAQRAGIAFKSTNLA